MVTRLTDNGDTIRVDHFARWYGRLGAVPLIAAAFWFYYNAFLGLEQDVTGEGTLSDNLLGLLVFALLGLALGLPGLMVLTFRYFVVIEKTLRRVIVTRQFGPARFRTHRLLSEFNLISIVDNGEGAEREFDVSLCGSKGTKPLVLATFTERQAAEDFARETGSALTLPCKDYVGTEPDDPDLEAEAAATLRHDRRPARAGAA
jgi:hypothetical protein